MGRNKLAFGALNFLLILIQICSMRVLFSFLLLLSAHFLSAQSNEATGVEKMDTSVFEKAEIEPAVDMQQWIDHLTKKLQSPIEKAARKGMKAGKYMVNVRFLVERDGSINYVEALNDPGYGLAKAAVKVVRTGPKWTAGEVDGKKVRSYHTQPISFIIQEM